MSLSNGNVNSLVCLTEESVETLFLLGRENLIKGVSCFVERPVEAKALPVVTSFIKADVNKILKINPDLIIGFSDIQKEIAKELIGLGKNVLVTNQRSIDEILHWIYRLSLLVDAKNEGIDLIQKLKSKIEEVSKKSKLLKKKIKVYFEEWDEPMISGIKWVSELIKICGGEDIFDVRSVNSSLAKERFVDWDEVIEKDPDIIFLCWCGKKANIDEVRNRKGAGQISAVKHNHIYELDPAIFLQPGPAPILDGLDVMFSYIQKL